MISADSHVVEPADLWVTRLEPQFRQRAPRIESLPDGDYQITEGVSRRRVSGAEGGMAIVKMAGEAITDRMYRYDEQRPGAGDPMARLADQDLDGIEAEVVYPGWLSTFAMPDVDLRVACMRVYNDWIAEFCAVAPHRLVGAAQLPLVEDRLDLAIAEAQRAEKLGLGAVMLPHGPGVTYDHAEYNPLWEALQDLGIPITIHITTGTITASSHAYPSGTAGHTINITKSKTGISAAAIELLWGGVPARYPGLRFVMTEGGIGWIAFVLRFMDHWWEDHHRRLSPKLDEPPSFYFHRQFWATFEDDRPGILTLPMLNVDHLMWSNDYPHTEGTWPNSARQIDKDMGGLPEPVRRKLVHDNAAALYGLG